MMSSAGAELPRYNSRGTELVFQDIKGYEDALRKHHTSSITRDIWIMNAGNKGFRQISAFQGEDREPVWSRDDQFIYYLSEKNGHQNLYKTAVQNRSTELQLTRFEKHPVRHLSISRDNLLCFTQNGDLYTLKEGGNPQKLIVYIGTDDRENAYKTLPVNEEVSEFTLSPDGKEIAFVSRGEVFVSATEGGITRRVTHTPQQERMVTWAPDGRSLVYAAERGNSWDLYQASISQKEDPHFYTATRVTEKALMSTMAEEYQPQFSPDGKKLAFVENRNILKVLTLATNAVVTLLPKGRNFSYSDGDWGYQWSPDSKWIISDDQEGAWISGNLALMAADGKGGIQKPIAGGYGQYNLKWGIEGRVILFQNNRYGRRGAANNGSTEDDVFAAFLDPQAWEKFRLTKEEFQIDKERTELVYKYDSSKLKEDTMLRKNWTPVLTYLEDRVIRLTPNSSSIGDFVLNADGSRLFYSSAFEKGFDIWVTEPRTRKTKMLVKLGAAPGRMMLSKDEKSLFLISNGSITRINTESGEPAPVGIRSEMDLNTQAERAYMFEHVWRQVKEKFYDPRLHDVDWAAYKADYMQFLPHINNNFDFEEMLSELLGELNASHTGSSYRYAMPNADNTASLGLLYDETYTGPGLKVTEVLSTGPLDKPSSRLKAGDVITMIDANAITEDTDWARWLNRKAGQPLQLTVTRGNNTWNELVKPISFGQESALMYKRWIRRMQQMTDSLSGGKIGYVHVQSMDDGSYRAMVEEVMGRNRDKMALVVDTRFNGGGWLHNDLNTFLSGKRYLDFAPQGQRVTAGEPYDRWTKPSVVIMSESNYSDAFIFPYIYRQNGLGKLVGMPVAGTGTAVWWERMIDPDMVFGIPMVATIGKENRPTENLQLEPDIRVPLPYEEFMKGKDAQLEAAVKELMKKP